MNDLYKRIEDLCKDKNVSITKMCREAGVSRAPLTELKMERTQKLSADNLDRVASYFGVSVSYLLGTEKNAPEKSEALNESDLRLIEWFRSLPTEKQKAILASQDAPEGLV